MIEKEKIRQIIYKYNSKFGKCIVTTSLVTILLTTPTLKLSSDSVIKTEISINTLNYDKKYLINILLEKEQIIQDLIKKLSEVMKVDRFNNYNMHINYENMEILELEKISKEKDIIIDMLKIETQKISQKEDLKYLERVKEVGLENFEQNFLDFYKSGIINYLGNDYQLEYFYIVYGYDSSNNLRKYLTYTKEQKLNFFSENTEVDFKQIGAVKFKNTTSLYNLYKFFTKEQNVIYIRNLNEAVMAENYIINWDGYLHTCAPETFAMEKHLVLDLKSNKVK